MELEALLMLRKWPVKNVAVAKKIYTDWANHYLEKARNKRSITDLQQDISDGVLLADVIEAVTNEKVRDIKSKPRNGAQMVENINACLSYLASLGVNTEGISAKDIREGNLKTILGLFFSLSRYKQQQKQSAATNAARNTNANANAATTESKLPLLNKQSKCPTVTNPSKDSSSISSSGSNLNRKAHSFTVADRTKSLNQQNNNTLSVSGSVPGRTVNARDTTCSSRSTSPSTTSNSLSPSSGIPIPGGRTSSRSRSPSGGSKIGRSQSLSEKPSHRIVNSTSTSSASSATSVTSKTTSNSSVTSGTSRGTSGYSTSASGSSTISSRTTTNKNSMLDKFKFFGSKDKSSKGALPKTNGSGNKDTGGFLEPSSPKSRRRFLGKSSSSKRDSSGSKDSRDDGSRSDLSRSRPTTPTATSGHVVQRSVTPPASYGRAVQQRPVTPPASYGRTIVPRPTTPPATHGRLLQQPQNTCRRTSPTPQRRTTSLPKSDSKTDLKSGQMKSFDQSKPFKQPPAPPPQSLKFPATGLNSPNATIALPTSGIPKPGSSKPANKAALHRDEKRMRDVMLQQSSGRGQISGQNGNGNGNYALYDPVYSSRFLTDQGQRGIDQSQSASHSRAPSQSRDFTQSAEQTGATAHAQDSLDRNANMSEDVKNNDYRKQFPDEDAQANSFTKFKSCGSAQTVCPVVGFIPRKLPKTPDEAKNAATSSESSSSHSVSNSQSDKTAIDVSTSAGKYVKSRVQEASNGCQENYQNQEDKTSEAPVQEDESMNVKPMAPLARASPYAYLRGVPNGSAPSSRGAQRPAPGAAAHRAGPLMAQYGSNARLRSMMAGEGAAAAAACGRYPAKMGGSASRVSDEASDGDVDLATGYMSDGDILRKNQADDLSGYMSEGNASIYARKMQQKFREGMMQAVEECMRKSNHLIDDDSFDDSSSISSGDISDTIGDISTDENLGSTHSACSDYSHLSSRSEFTGLFGNPSRRPTNIPSGPSKPLASRNYTGYDYTAWRKSAGTTATPYIGDSNYAHLDYSSEPDTSTLTSWRRQNNQQHTQQPTPQQADYKPGYYATSSLRRNSDNGLQSAENLLQVSKQRCPPPSDPDSMIIMRKNQQQQVTGMPMSTFGFRRPVSATSNGGGGGGVGTSGTEPPIPTRNLSGKPPTVKRNGRGDYENIYTTPDGSPRRSYTTPEDSPKRSYPTNDDSPKRSSLVPSKTQTFANSSQDADAYKSNTLGRRRTSIGHIQGPEKLYGSGSNLQKALSNDKLGTNSTVIGNPHAAYAALRYGAQTGGYNSDRGRSMSMSIPNPTNPQNWLGQTVSVGSVECLTTGEVQAKIQQARALAGRSADLTSGEKPSDISHRRSQSQSLDRDARNSGQLNSAPVSPTPSTVSQNASRFTYPMTSLSPSHVARSTSNQSLSRPSSQLGMPYSYLPKSASRDEDFHGSSLSLASSSSLYSTPNEEKQAAEIRKLRRELESAQEKVSTLTTQLSTNAHVVSAFEQSLSNMTHRLQALTSTSEQKSSSDPAYGVKDKELKDLRVTIESIKKQSGDIRIDYGCNSLNSTPAAIRRISAPTQVNPLSVYHSPEHLPDPGSLTRQLSTESMSSLNSMSSACSLTSQQSSLTDADKKNKDKKNKGGWLRSSFSKAFNNKKKGRKGSGSLSDAEGDAASVRSDISAPGSPMFMTSLHGQAATSGCVGHSQTAPSTPMNGIKQSHSSHRLMDDNESVQNLQKKLQEKDMKLTDIQLEALTSAHQLEQLREAMNKMKNEMSTLKADNERLQKMVVSSKSNTPTSPDPSKSMKSSIEDMDRTYSLQEHASNIDLLLNETGQDGRRVLISVYTGNETDVPSLVKSKPAEVLIGSMCITGKIRWDMLDSIIRRYFKDYCIRVDPACHLGLNSESVHSYHIGDIVRSKDADITPELLPCGYLVGQDMQIKIILKGTEQQAVDSLSFETLIPKSIIQRYISLLVEHRRIILCGPSGTGKTYLAHKLAEFLVRRSGRSIDDSGAISTFSVEHKSSKDLRQYLATIAEKCQASQDQGNDLPCVIILDNLHHVGSLSEVFDGFLSCKYQTSPYIIGTMNQATCSTTNLQLHHNFRWVLCANHMEPVKGFLGRFLRRKLIEGELTSGARSPDLTKMVDWMPSVWQKLNKFLETHSSSDVTIGPRLFLSCPMDVGGSQVWFTDLYNYSLVPYLIDATREGLQLYGRRAPWEDPADWVIETYPWPHPNTQDWPSLLRLRPEDVGYDMQTMTAPGTPNKAQQQPHTAEADQDPLLNMLMRLQEAASYTNSPQSGAEIDAQNQDVPESTI